MERRQQMTDGCQLVWFKRDLRVTDHRPLREANQKGSCLCVYVYEPEIIHSPEFDSSHLLFINQSLTALDAQLRQRGSRLVLLHGSIPDVFEKLYRQQPFETIWSHQETGNDLTYRRDLRVARWAKSRGIGWEERRQNGVIRRLSHRDGWARRWDDFTRERVLAPPQRITSPNVSSSLPVQSLEALGLKPCTKPEIQRGGEEQAHATLATFLEIRGGHYHKEMSSPVTAGDSCSRLSAYLAWGCISIRQIAQAVRARSQEVSERRRSGEKIDGAWSTALRSFESRLRWHCHFMQKLEDEPRIEFENMARICDGLREDDFDEERFAAWCAGRTGYPMVDACMRALHQTGWINFRMRAMLVSFASYHLWLHWRRPAVFLAKHFLDFEPGIHFPQFQMQSGTTGINTLRIYSPTKQVMDQDPEGTFIRRFVPELTNVSTDHIAEPAKMTLSEQEHAGCIIGMDYPAPIVDHLTAYKAAWASFASLRRRPEARAERQKILVRHGSRKPPGRHNRRGGTARS